VIPPILFEPGTGTDSGAATADLQTVLHNELSDISPSGIHLSSDSESADEDHTEALPVPVRAYYRATPGPAPLPTIRTGKRPSSSAIKSGICRVIPPPIQLSDSDDEMPSRKKKSATLHLEMHLLNSLQPELNVIGSNLA